MILTARLGQTVDERKQELIERQVDLLENERVKLLRAKEPLEEEADGDIGTLEEELIKLKAGWPNYRFKKRRSLINFAIQEVIIDVMSTHWMRVEVLWLHEEWGREEMYYRRDIGGARRWSQEEISIMLEHYVTMPRLQLMELLPDRGWDAIVAYASEKGLHRPRGFPKGQPMSMRKAVRGDSRDSYSDLQFLQKKNIPDYTTDTNCRSMF